MKYDDASWHYGGNFPDDLPHSAGATHSGMFLSWALLNGLAGSIHTENVRDDLAKLKARDLTPGEFLRSACDVRAVWVVFPILGMCGCSWPVATDTEELREAEAALHRFLVRNGYTEEGHPDD